MGGFTVSPQFRWVPTVGTLFIARWCADRHCPGGPCTIEMRPISAEPSADRRRHQNTLMSTRRDKRRYGLAHGNVQLLQREGITIGASISPGRQRSGHSRRSSSSKLELSSEEKAFF